MKVKCVDIKEQELSKEEIFEKRLFNVFVFGHPRSGTSMMTKICDSLGVNIIQTSESADKINKMREQYKKKFGEYVPNDYFYEITENQFGNWIKIISKSYSGCKVIIPVKGYRWEAVKYKPSRVIMMWRDVEEIRQSQQAFYRGNSEEDAEARRAFLEAGLANTTLQLKKAEEVDYVVVNYRSILEKPREVISKIAEFINAPNDIEEAVKIVNPNKVRFKKEKLVLNI